MRCFIGIEFTDETGMNENLLKLIDQFKKLKVLVIGDAIADVYVKGVPEKICREAPVMVYNVQEYDYQCGGAANTAINLAALGAETYFLTVTGKDANAKELIDVLRQNKVHTEYILKDRSRTTIAKKRLTSAGNILMRMDEGTTTPVSELCQKEMIERLTELFPYIDAVVLSDYAMGIITSSLIEALISLKKNSSKLIIADARDLRKYKMLQPDAVKPNYEETVKLLNLKKDSLNRQSQVIHHSEALHKITGAKLVAATLDAQGVVLLEKDKDPHIISCIPKDNKNAIGAGDTFISALTLSLAVHATVEEAGDIAAAAAAVVVEKDGTVGCTNTELKGYFNALPKYIRTNEHLNNIIKELRKQKKKIVFTNGCFDILHKGHINLLNSARREGDVLIVGVNNDESIRRVKGPERPINSLEDRITVLSGLESVDYIFAFEEESPVHLIKAVHPDVFVKGATYTENNIPESPLLKKLGCEVKIVPYTQDRSTTQIINKIRDINHVEVMMHENAEVV
ncbi:MAG: D-glycero-beta-D-manno-heptose 1-phosphate adenylyltransferase [Ilyomonas sp.]